MLAEELLERGWTRRRGDAATRRGSGDSLVSASARRVEDEKTNGDEAAPDAAPAAAAGSAAPEREGVAEKEEEDEEGDDATTRALKAAFVRVDHAMKKETDWDCSLSGTTASVALITRGVLYAASCGDSRTVMGFESRRASGRGDSSEEGEEEQQGGRRRRRRQRSEQSEQLSRGPSGGGGGPGRVGADVDAEADVDADVDDADARLSLSAEQVTVDHRPCDERERLVRAGGRVTSGWGGRRMDVKTGPERLWLQDLQMPGILVSRSLGDEIASSVGCIPEPEVTRRPLRFGDRVLIVASDGVWDMLGNEEVMAIAARSLKEFPAEDQPGEECPRAVASAVLESALRQWGERGLSDNVGLITVIIKETTGVAA